MGEKLRVFEAFSGYGSQSIALRNIGVDYEVGAISEIDKYAIQAYEAIHGKANNLGDISKINVRDIPNHDLFTYSFPCQDISVAGNKKGIERGKTRSGLLYECEKIIEAKRPKYLLMENVKNLVSKKFKSQFDEWLNYLEQLGYTNYWQVLNSKDYGIPQNRERMFVVSILGEHKPYEFPDGTELSITVLDLLEKNVPNKYNMSDKCIEKMKRFQPRDASRGYLSKLIAPVLTTELAHSSGKNFYPKMCIILNEYRRITPREAFRLMGMRDEDIDKIQSIGISDTQQYKMAGNSIVVNVLEAIFKNLFK